MSAQCPVCAKSDLHLRSCDVANVPEAAVRNRSNAAVIRLVGSYLQTQWNCKSECFGSFEVYKEFKFGRLQDR